MVDYPLVVLATVATIIASQAIITGSFSLTRQAMQLGWFPGVEDPPDLVGGIRPDLRAVRELDDDGADGCLTVSFGSSDRLAGAYGTAVSTTMLLTTALLYNVMRERWRWPTGRGAARERHVSCCRFRVLRGQSVQDPRGWLDSAAVRRRWCSSS